MWVGTQLEELVWGVVYASWIIFLDLDMKNEQNCKRIIIVCEFQVLRVNILLANADLVMFDPLDHDYFIVLSIFYI